MRWREGAINGGEELGRIGEPPGADLLAGELSGVGLDDEVPRELLDEVEGKLAGWPPPPPMFMKRFRLLGRKRKPGRIMPENQKKSSLKTLKNLLLRVQRQVDLMKIPQKSKIRRAASMLQHALKS